MEGFKGTEGKWKVIDGKSSGKQVVSDSAPKNRMTVASCGGQRREENANLIAAAPELLQALQTVKQEVGHFLMHQAPELLSEIDTAIAKALGR